MHMHIHTHMHMRMHTHTLMHVHRGGRGTQSVRRRRGAETKTHTSRRAGYPVSFKASNNGSNRDEPCGPFKSADVKINCGISPAALTATFNIAATFGNGSWLWYLLIMQK